MRVSLRRPLPLLPLLRAYTDAGIPRPEELAQLPGLGPRFAAVLAVREHLLNERFLDGATEEEFRAALVGFYSACVQPALHVETIPRRAGIVRHALNHILRCPD